MSSRFSLLLLFSLVTCNTVRAQSQMTDSLQKVLVLHPERDTIRLDILNDLAYYYSEISPVKGIDAADSAISLATLLKDERRLASAFNYKALNYASMGKDSVAISWFGKAITIHKKKGYKRGIASVLHNMGISYANLSQYQEALSCQLRAYDICKEINNQEGIATTLNSIGVIHLFLSDYPKALSYYFEALKIHEALKDTFSIGVAFTNIGLVYHHAADLKKALEYQHRAAHIFKEQGSAYNLQNSLGNLGNLYVDAGDIDSALQYFQQALQINENLGNQNGIASVYMNMGAAFFHKNDFLKAHHYLQQALKMYRSSGNNYGAGHAINYLADIYLKAGDSTLKRIGIAGAQKIPQALLLQKEGIRMGVLSGNLDIQRDGWKNLSAIYKAEKQFEKALEAYQKFILFRDSVFNQEKQHEIAGLTMQFAFEKKEASEREHRNQERMVAAAALEKQKLVKRVILAGTVILLIASLVSFILYKRKRDAEEKQKQALLAAQITDKEMKALRAQMNPHFIFNSLNSISDFINKNDPETADYYLTRFAMLMRMILENSEQKEIPLKDELKALELYMQLEALRLNGSFSYQIVIDEHLDPGNVLVPPLLLQPYVENCIWHGFANQSGKGRILIDIRRNEDMIHCVVEDNGEGNQAYLQKNKTQKSYGMKITSSRIELLNSMKKARSSVLYRDKPDGTRVEIQLPLLLNF